MTFFPRQKVATEKCISIYNNGPFCCAQIRITTPNIERKKTCLIAIQVVFRQDNLVCHNNSFTHLGNLNNVTYYHTETTDYRLTRSVSDEF